MNDYQLLEEMLRRSVADDIVNQLKNSSFIYFDKLDIEYKVFLKENLELDIEIVEIKTPKEYLLIDLIANEIKKKIKKELKTLELTMAESLCINEFLMGLEIYSFDIQSFGDSFYRDSYLKVKVQDCEAEKDEVATLRNVIENLGVKMYKIINQSVDLVLADAFNSISEEDIDFEPYDDTDEEDIGL